ncbi:MAG: DNA-binding response regulator [Hyphomicrobiales bacterium]|nr:MAG: DNA-binding response regulator [Hyphomicrobiales bacterium]
MRVLVVEDDKRIARDVVAAVKAQGFIVTHESDGEEAWFLGDTEDYDAVVLDLGLPSMDGLAVLKRWRANGRDFPILVLSARGTWAERVEGIEAGADDYLPKPFQMEELVARLRAIVRRSSGHATPVISDGVVSLDTRTMRVSVEGVPISLSPQEYKLVAYLMMQKGRVVSQIELTEHLYAQDYERDSNAIEVLVGRTRRKIGAELIKTKRGFGYYIGEETA